MISQGLPAAAPQKAPVASLKPQAGGTSAFALLMRGTAPAPAQTLQSLTPKTEGGADPALPEGLDTDTAEGLMALLDHTIAGLENGGGPITGEQVLAAFATALGEAPVEGAVEAVGDLAVVSQLGDATLEAALQDRIAGAVRSAIPISQLSIASAAMPAVARGASGAEQSRTQGNSRQAPVGQGTPQPAEIVLPDPKADADARPMTVLMNAAKATQAGQAAPFAELAAREAAPVTAAVQPPAEFPRATAMPTAAPPPAAAPTAEGLMALLDHTIAGLENGGGPITGEQVLAAFATALGEAPFEGAVEAVGDLVVSQLGDATLEAALQDRIAGAVRSAIPISQLSIASAAMPAVARGASGAEQSRTQGNSRQAPVGQGTPQPAEIVLPDPKADADARPMTVLMNATKATQAGQVAPFAELAAREAAPVTAAVQPPAEFPRATAMPTAAPPPAAAPDEMLRQHVAQQIRAVDTADAKFRFSLTPYGMGEIEIEIARTEAGRIQIAMTTETASVLNVLRHDREQLLDALNARGIQTQNADLDFQTFGERGRQNPQQAEGGPLSDPTTDQDQAEEPQPVVLRPTYSSGTLDILT